MVLQISVMTFRSITILVLIIVNIARTEYQCSEKNLNDHLQIKLTAVASIQTQGNAGWESFRINNSDYLSVANFWNGYSQDMSATSTVYNLSKLNNTLELIKIFEFPSRGGHSVDFFEISESSKYLVTTNYYQCIPESDVPCDSITIYKWNENLQTFNLFQYLKSKGPSQTDHFYFNNKHYIVVADNFANEIIIFIFDTSLILWLEYQRLPCIGIAAIAIAEMNNTNGIILIGASYHNEGWSTQSFVYQMNHSKYNIHNQFILIQEINTYGAHDAELQFYNQQLFLFFSEDRNEQTSRIQSNLYKFNEIEKRFVYLQNILTDGAHAAELFVVTNYFFLIIANFGDRHNKRYKSNSELYIYNIYSDEFEIACTIETVGATDWEYFEINTNKNQPLNMNNIKYKNLDTNNNYYNDFYLAVSNEGDIENRVDQISNIYQLHLIKLYKNENTNDLEYEL